MLDADPRVDQIMKTTTIFNQVWTMNTSPLGLTKVGIPLKGQYDRFFKSWLHLVQNFFLIKVIYLKKYKNATFASKMHVKFHFCIANFIRRASKQRKLP